MSDQPVNKSRFSGPSDAIDLNRLEHETKKLFFLGLLVAVLLNATAGAIFFFHKSDLKVVRPSMVEFIIVKPKMNRIMKIGKRTSRKRTYQRSQIKRRSHQVTIPQRYLPDPEYSIKMPEYDISFDIEVVLPFITPFDYNIEQTILKDPERMISMKDEFISLSDLDTGQYKAMIIQNPQNKQQIKGFVYIPTTWGVQLKPPDELKRATLNLVEAVNRYTSIEAKSDPHLMLDSRKIHNMPFVYITTDRAFEMTEIERRNFASYLRNGGFALLDNGTPGHDFGQAEASLRHMLRSALGSDAQFLPIPNSHPLYHSFFDFDDGPPLGGEIRMMSTTSTEMQGVRAINSYMTKRVSYLEGIWLDDRLVAIYSDKGYATKWKDYTNNDPQLKMGVNMVVYALTQRGGIARQKMDMYLATER
ncbi:DUF4159 domain-containing protein [Candidatus Latescibacterota bacterium]